MSLRIIQRKHLLLLILAIIFLFAGAGCGSSKASQPQPGDWTANVAVTHGNGNTENWVVYFTVSNDGKKVPTVQLMHYTGELRSDTKVTLVFTDGDYSIKKNSFEFSTFDSTKGKVKFTSAKEAAGTLHVGGQDYQFTAAPKQK
ncbi:MAG: hypothetical protein FWC60_06600 [Firmicutes bacterium]|nr:hypothetical protein [Bacillota bacterium]